jgi:hypothetical protein
MLPVIYIGAGLAALYAGAKLSETHQKQKKVVSHFPGETQQSVLPKAGSIVCCEVYHVLDHTGIWTEEGIVELNGNGLIRCISPKRFLQERSGNNIYVACDPVGQPLYDAEAANRALTHIYTYTPYHLLNNNCHQFVARLMASSAMSLTSFADLNEYLAIHFGCPLSWRRTK